MIKAVTAIIAATLLFVGCLLYYSHCQNQRLPAVEAATRSPEIRVASISARLLHRDTGDFSPNVIGNPEYKSFWNGRDTSNETFVSALIIVKVAGERGSVTDTTQVRLVARGEGKTQLDKSVPVGMLNDKGVTYFGFWIYDCPWKPLYLRAQIVGNPSKSIVRATIPFNGGE